MEKCSKSSFETTKYQKNYVFEQTRKMEYTYTKSLISQQKCLIQIGEENKKWIM